METTLKEALWAYIANENPDLMYDLQEDYKVSDYLDEKVGNIIPEIEHLLNDGLPMVTIQEICMEKLTKDLKPSKFQYIREIIEKEFPIAYEALQQSGMLTFEVINIIDSCERVFDRFGFSADTIESKGMRYAVIAEVDFYLR